MPTAARTITVVNSVDQTIWVASDRNKDHPLPVTGWVLAPGQSTSFTVDDKWGGRIWGRTGCRFDTSGRGRCQTGDCGGVFQCTGGGATLPGQPAVLYSVRSSRPTRVRLTPDYLAFRGTDSTATIVAAVTDSLGNPVSGEPVDLSGGIGTPLTAITDSVGRATLTVTAGSVTRGGTLQVRVRGLAPVEMEIAAPAGLSGVNTGFLPVGSAYGSVGNALSEPLIFRARTVQGAAAAGHTVHFRTLNARVAPESAVLDSTGRVRVDVVLGIRAGESAVIASIDSVERIVTLRAEPGPIDSLILDRNGETVNGRAIIVQVGVPFALRLRARDLYGNATSIEALGQALRTGRARLNVRQQDLQLITLEAADTAVVVTLKAARLGSYQFVIGSGITANVRVDAVQQRP